MRKKKITKAMAYLLASVTAMSSLSGAMPVMAAEQIIMEETAQMSEVNQNESLITSNEADLTVQTEEETPSANENVDETTQDAEKVVSENVDNSVDNTVDEISDDTSVASDETKETVDDATESEENSNQEEETEETDKSEEDEEDLEAEDPESDNENEELKEEVVKDLLFETIVGNTRVLVEGSIDALPEGGSITARLLSDDEFAALAEQIKDTHYDYRYEVEVFRAIDVSILDADGNEIEPNDTVKVTFEDFVPKETVKEVIKDDATNAAIFHYVEDSDGNVEDIEEVGMELEGSTVVFETDSFSLYTGTTITDNTQMYFADEQRLRGNNGETGTVEGSFYHYGHESVGTVQVFTAPSDGVYYVEAIGAGAGGSDGSQLPREVSYANSDGNGLDFGYGGYSSGTINLKAGDKLYVTVGGAGSRSDKSGEEAKGGYNGGGSTANGAYSGGGASAVYTTLKGTGLLTDYVSDKGDILIVAGGAGGPGAGGFYTGGNGSGGGMTGSGVTLPDQTEILASAGTQESGYRFGQGQAGQYISENGLSTGGAGGGLYGGTTGLGSFTNEKGVQVAIGGAGGSGYLNLGKENEDGTYKAIANSEGNFFNLIATNNFYNGFSTQTKDKYSAHSGRTAVYGDGEVAITRVGDVKSTLRIDLTDLGTYDGKTGVVEVINTAGAVVDLNAVQLTDTEKKIIGWTAVYGYSAGIHKENKTFTFSGVDDYVAETLIQPVIYKDFALTSAVQSSNEPEFKNYTYGDQTYLKWEEMASNNAQILTRYSVYQALRDGEFKELQTADYGAMAANPMKYNYSGKSETYKAPYAGTYTVLLYGAAGGGDGGSSGGKGAYIKGTIELNADDVLTINVGGQGPSSRYSYSNRTPGGYNGGGSAIWSGAGGGRSDIKVNGQYVVAAAGGGGATHGIKGYAGKISTDTSGTVSGMSGENDNQDAGGGGGGWRGGKSGVHEGKSGARGGYGGCNGFSGAFTLIEESAGVRGGNGYIEIIPPTGKEGIYQKNTVTDTSDLDAPERPSNGSVVRVNEDKTVTVQWDPSDDNGTLWRHYVEAKDANEEISLGASNITEDVITSGVVGYYYYTDNNETGTVTKEHNYTEEANGLAPLPQTSERVYVHVAAVDAAGNLGETYDFPLECYFQMIGSVNWVDQGDKHGVRPVEVTYKIYQDGILYDQITLKTKHKNYDEVVFTDLPIGYNYEIFQEYADPENESVKVIRNVSYDFTNKIVLTVEKKVFDMEGNDFDGQFVSTGDQLHYEVHWFNESARDTKISVFDQLSEYVEYVAPAEGNPEGSSVQVITTEAERLAYNASAIVAGYDTIPAEMDLDTPIVVIRAIGHHYNEEDADTESWKDGEAAGFIVKVKETAETQTILNEAQVNFGGLKKTDGGNVMLPTNEVTNIVRYNPKKDVLNEAGESIDKQVVDVKDTLTYRIKFENVSFEEEETAIVVDKLPEEVTFVSATSGGVYDAESHSVRWEVKAPCRVLSYVDCTVAIKEDTKDKEILNKASVTLNGVTPETNEVENPVLPDPVKTVTNKNGEDKDGIVASATQELFYHISFKNPSEEERIITITDALPKEMEYVAADQNGSYDKENHTVVWTIEAAGKAEGEVSVRVKVSEEAKGKQLVNKALVAVDQADVETNEVKTPVLKDPVKEVLDVDGEDMDLAVIEDGSEMTYKITIENPADSEKIATIKDTLPETVVLVKSSISHDGSYNEDTRAISWNVAIPAKKAVSVQFTVQVKDGVKNAEIMNHAEASMDDAKEITNDVVTYTMEDPIKKVLDENDKDIHTKIVAAGSELHYEISFINPSPKEKEFTITDELPKGTEFVSATDDGHMENGKVIFVVNAAGKEEKSVRFTVKVLEEAKGAVIKNTAHVLVDRVDKKTNEVINYVMEDPVKQVLDEEGTDINRMLRPIGSELYYVITIKNPSLDEKVFTIIDEVPSYVSFVGSRDGKLHKTKEKNYVEMELKLKGHETGSVTWIASIDSTAQGQDIVNVARVLCDQADVKTNEVHTFVLRDLWKCVYDENGKDINGQIVQSGDKGIFTITYFNPSDKQQNIMIYDSIVKELEKYITITKIHNDGKNNGEVISWYVTADANSEGKVSFEFTVKEVAESGVVKNIASAVIEENTISSNEVQIKVLAQDARILLGDVQTGDHTNIFLYLGLMAGSLALLFGMIQRAKKKETDTIE